MPHQISIIENGTIIQISYSGGVGLTERIEAVEEVCTMSDCTHTLLLVDIIALENQMSVKDQLYFGQYLANRAELKQAKVAVLSQADKRDPNTIINATAYENGYQLVPFSNRSDALNWLKGCIA